MSKKQYFPADLFAGKAVFVTGGGSGINFGIVKQFAELGANIAICGRTKEKLDQAIDELGSFPGKKMGLVIDVRDYDALEKGFLKVKEEIGPIDVLVCGAAGNFLCKTENLSANGFKSVVDIDLLGSFNASRAAFAQLKETKGSIIFISAGQAFTPYIAQAHVGAAKAGIDNLMKNLAMEWGPFGIRSNSIAPGPIDKTEGMQRLASDELKKKMTSMIPLRRLGDVEDIGHAAVFLASPLADYITGCCLVVDGGQNLGGTAWLNDFFQNSL